MKEIVLKTQIVGNDKQQMMTSLEIAELTGKQHKNVMQAIRNMEPAWEKVCKSKFRLTFRIIATDIYGHDSDLYVDC